MAGPHTLKAWRWQDSHVNTSVTGSTYISAESSIVLAGPPVLIAADTEKVDELFVIGIKGNMQVMQNRGNMRIFEIGAILGYIIASKVIPSMILSSMLVHGPSLLAAMYKYQYEHDAVFTDEVKAGMGYGDAMLSLTNQGAKNPIGLCLIMRDNKSQPYGGIYLENCYPSSHVLSTDGTGIIIREDMNVDLVNVRPVNLSAKALT